MPNPSLLNLMFPSLDEPRFLGSVAHPELEKLGIQPAPISGGSHTRRVEAQTLREQWLLRLVREMGRVREKKDKCFSMEELDFVSRRCEEIRWRLELLASINDQWFWLVNHEADLDGLLWEAQRIRRRPGSKPINLKGIRGLFDFPEDNSEREPVRDEGRRSRYRTSVLAISSGVIASLMVMFLGAFASILEYHRTTLQAQKGSMKTSNRISDSTLPKGSPVAPIPFVEGEAVPAPPLSLPPEAMTESNVPAKSADSDLPR